MNNQLAEIKDIINKHTNILQKDYHVKNVGIFGSVAKGDQKETSDVDILVELSEPLGLFKFVELENFLGKILKKKVDLTTKGALKPIIKDNILKEIIYV